VPKLQRGIKEEGNQVKFGTQLYGTLLPVAIAPTKSEDHDILKIEDYGLKYSLT
jgi:hypothetical protein